MVTSNRSVGEWGEVFGDAVAATAILDRLPAHRGRRQPGTLPAVEAPATVGKTGNDPSFGDADEAAGFL